MTPDLNARVVTEFLAGSTLTEICEGLKREHGGICICAYGGVEGQKILREAMIAMAKKERVKP